MSQNEPLLVLGFFSNMAWQLGSGLPSVPIFPIGLNGGGGAF